MSQSGKLGGQNFSATNDIPDKVELIVPKYASAPPYVKGNVYFDTTLNKLRVGGATSWETITSA